MCSVLYVCVHVYCAACVYYTCTVCVCVCVCVRTECLNSVAVIKNAN